MSKRYGLLYKNTMKWSKFITFRSFDFYSRIIQSEQNIEMNRLDPVYVYVCCAVSAKHKHTN